jgi:membrane-bound lytic murein transglycosylase MltF
MQLMPHTASLFGVDSTSSMADQLEAGVRYLHTLDTELPKEIRDAGERLKFILASYNVGIAHVLTRAGWLSPDSARRSPTKRPGIGSNPQKVWQQSHYARIAIGSSARVAMDTEVTDRENA